jgi:hypothetical protein
MRLLENEAAMGQQLLRGREFLPVCCTFEDRLHDRIDAANDV